MRWLAAPAGCALLIGHPADARQLPLGGSGDPRIQTMAYHADQVIRLAAAPGYETTVDLAADEQVQTIGVGDSAAWQVTPSRDGAHVFVKAIGEAPTTNMTVITNVRRYAFQLEALPAGAPGQAYTLRFDYPRPASAADMPTGVVGRYRLTGDRALMPVRISDDGRRTFVEWPETADLPAVYMVDAQGREALVNGMFRGDRLVIDAVVSHLVFRIDGAVARADRRPPDRKR